ncbi:hypothetical protein PR202_ga13530 [Eleusine coracana subsp. coracana]|uniref:Uncharacterized protein n=1 Tax=Eleusine coracana subsp. coracana TaxID=191504 RepID=A0AAV5CEC9_ELECO|nr:hypothetical protein PR202_ga13530 [Eleusine coracana subsp. coracana]
MRREGGEEFGCMRAELDRAEAEARAKLGDLEACARAELSSCCLVAGSPGCRADARGQAHGTGTRGAG